MAVWPARTIASRANVPRMGFMILILGKGLTADYTNNADGEGIEMNDESISGGSKVEYQVRIDFRNRCYPRNPWLNPFCENVKRPGPASGRRISAAPFPSQSHAPAPASCST